MIQPAYIESKTSDAHILVEEKRESGGPGREAPSPVIGNLFFHSDRQRCEKLDAAVTRP